MAVDLNQISTFVDGGSGRMREAFLIASLF